MPHKTIEERERDIEKCWEMRCLGLQADTIAKELGVSRETVFRYIKKKLKDAQNDINFNDERKAEIWATLKKAEQEAWKRFKLTNSVRALAQVIKIQDRLMLMIGVGKQDINITQTTNNLTWDSYGKILREGEEKRFELLETETKRRDSKRKS